LRDEVIYHFETYIHGMPGEMIEYHISYLFNWWESLKEKWLPPYIKQYFPVQYKRHDFKERQYLAVCSHLIQ